MRGRERCSEMKVGSKGNGTENFRNKVKGKNTYKSYHMKRFINIYCILMNLPCILYKEVQI